MATQAGDVFIRGTIDDLTYYRMEGKYYVRMKSSLTGKKFWKSKAFEGSRRSCWRFAEGNRIASRVYGTVEGGTRNYKLFCYLKRRAIQLLKTGASEMQTEEILVDVLVDFGVLERKPNKVSWRNPNGRFAQRWMIDSRCEDQSTGATKGLKEETERAILDSQPGGPPGDNNRGGKSERYYRCFISV